MYEQLSQNFNTTSCAVFLFQYFITFHSLRINALKKKPSFFLKGRVIKCVLLNFPVLCVCLSGMYNDADSKVFIAV